MKTVLVTGVCGGIGSATAKVFKREGWRVIGIDCTSRRADLFCDAFHETDLSNKEQIISLFARIHDQETRLDALVNNAAIQICKPLVETSAEEFDAIMAVNLKGAFLMMKYAHPLLKEHCGSIINVGSVHALGTSKNMAAYAASKGALEALTRAASVEFAADGIRVNGVHPGAVETEMLKAGLTRGHLVGDRSEVLLDQLARKHPLGRVGQGEEIAEAILFLADEKKSSFVTGSFLVVDGGALSRLSTE